MACGLGLHPANRHRDDLAGTGFEAGLHRFQAGIFARARHQAAAEASTADDQVVSVQRLCRQGDAISCAETVPRSPVLFRLDL